MLAAPAATRPRARPAATAPAPPTWPPQLALPPSRRSPDRPGPGRRPAGAPRLARRPAPTAAPTARLRPRPPRQPGQQLLAEAKALYTSGNYPAARQLAEEAKAGKFGVDAQADELLAQIGLAEQGGALSLYESALAPCARATTPGPAPS